MSPAQQAGATKQTGSAAQRLIVEKSLRQVLFFMLMWVIAVFLAMNFIDLAAPISPHEAAGYRGDGGYTKSLLLVYLPLLFMMHWYRKNRDVLNLRAILKALRQVVGVVLAAWVLLDVLFANLLFRFPARTSRVDSSVSIPGFTWDGDGCRTLRFWDGACWDWNIPIEEVLFYLGSAALLNMLYMWGAEDFFKQYSLPRPEYEAKAKATAGVVRPDWLMMAIGVGLFVFAVFAKKVWRLPGAEGLPYYFMAQLVIVFMPLVAFSRVVKPFCNSRSCLFACILTVLISLIWEGTLALPYGWWNYRMYSMIGPVVEPWFNLPIEAWVLWVSVVWSVMFNYEVAKIKAVTGRTWPQALFGRNSWWP